MTEPRIKPGGRAEIGTINFVFSRIAGRVTKTGPPNIFTTLGKNPRLMRRWLFFAGALMPGGKLPRIDTELVILRVAHVRGCEYELQHHRGMARNQGLDDDLQAAIFAWPETLERVEARLTVRQQALLAATDEFLLQRTVTDDTWRQLATHLDRRQLIEFCLLASQYDGLAATMSALAIPLDRPG
jgi:4-carboxymuconolactone decarboxylase